VMNSANQLVVYGNLGLRILARLFDLTLNFLFHILLLWLVSYLDIVGSVGMRGPIIGIFLASLGTSLLYFWIFSANGRQTFGYRLAGLEVQTVNGKPLSIGRALWRAIVLFVALNLWCCAIVPLFWALFDKHKRAGHDYLCGTQVVSVRSARISPLLATVGVFAAILFAAKADLFSPFPLRAYYLPSGSMEDTLQMNDRILVNTQIYRWHAPKNGEIVVFKAPRAALVNLENPDTDVDFIKRVVGVSGEKIEISKGQLKINGRLANEPYKKSSNRTNTEFDLINPVYEYDMKVVNGQVFSREYEIENQPGLWMHNGVAVSEAGQDKLTQAKTEAVPEGQLLVLGDNRANSNDSHIWGFVPTHSVRGRVMMRFWPLNNWRWFANSDVR
jgi:signal peptidase I